MTYSVSPASHSCQYNELKKQHLDFNRTKGEASGVCRSKVKVMLRSHD